MKVAFAVLVTLLNAALAAYAAYYSFSQLGKVGLAEWAGMFAVAIPYALVAVYGLRPGSRSLWNWALGLNGLIFLLCLGVNIAAYFGASAALFSVFSFTMFIAIFSPTLLPAIVLGLATVVVPYFVMQPSFGLGAAASKTPNPAQARLRSLMNHAVFGLGLYISALAISFVFRAYA